MLRHIALALGILAGAGQLAAAEPQPVLDASSGMNVFVSSHDYTSIPDLTRSYGKLLDRLEGLGVDAVAVTWPVFTGGVFSNTVFAGEGTPEDEALTVLFAAAKARGFTVFARPVLDEAVLLAFDPQEWRGTIRPRAPWRWFINYQSLIEHYAGVAEAAGVDGFIVGAELESMEQYTAEWRTLIGAVRERFSGWLTYSSNRGISEDIPWDELDFIGVDAFFDYAVPRTATFEELAAAMEELVPHLTATAKRLGKPLVFTEVGTTSQLGSFQKSWKWDHLTGRDEESQRLFYRATCAVWQEELAGIWWWVAFLHHPADPAIDTGFSPLEKAAEAEISRCFGETP